MFFCPECQHEMHVYYGAITTPLGVVTDTYICCDRCAVVSQVNTHTGQLIDLWPWTMGDLQSPIPTGETLPVSFMAVPRTLDGRRDS